MTRRVSNDERTRPTRRRAAHSIPAIPIAPRRVGAALTAALLAACGPAPAKSPTGGSHGTSPTGDIDNEAIPDSSELQKRLAALAPARPAAPSLAHQQITRRIDDYFQRASTQRLYVHLDKPMYQPGESVWFRVWELAAPTLDQAPSGHGITAQLVSPKGAVVLQKRVMVADSVATNDFVIPPDVPGGEYIARVASDLGQSFDRKFIVSTYQPPRLKKKLEFLRKAYGAGDKAVAALALNRATGEPLASVDATAIVTIDEAEIARFRVRTDGAGKTAVKFDLPATIARGDGLLTVLVEDGGVTESIQKRIPIVVAAVGLELFPEGGQLVTGLPGRVYFQAKNPIGKPADIEGRVVTESGAEVARLRSFHNGMGRFELTPTADTRYFVEITRPVGIAQKVEVPAAQAGGCSLQAVDDPSGERADLRVAVWCSEAQTVAVTGVLRERRLGDVAVPVSAAEPTVVALPVPAGAQGAIRVTAFDAAMQPVAERLIYRGRGADLKVAITPDRASYTPRDRVAMTVEARDLAGNPVEADLSLAVVDDTVLSFADDKTAHLLARLYLESEMPGQEIEEPNFYFSDDPKAGHAIDLVLGTQGWRRFEWQQVLAPPVPKATSAPGAVRQFDFADDDIEGELVRPDGEMVRADRRPRAARPKPAPPAQMRPMAAAKPALPKGGEVRGPRRAREVRAKKKPPARRRGAGGRGDAAGAMDLGLEDDADWGGADRNNAWAWAPVRQFPAPHYKGRYDGPRTDFRETIYWQPSVKTGRDGKARVEFSLSDAITSFRAIAEGTARGGLPGRGEALIQSKLPVSLAVAMPLEVSAGDRLKLPVTLTNETDRAYTARITTRFGKAFRVGGGIPGNVKLAPSGRDGARRSLFVDLQVVGDGKTAEDGQLSIAIETGNLRDEVEQTIRVVPLGFPKELSISGTVEKSARHEVVLAGALPGTVEAQVRLYPSPLATMVQGTEAIIREPTGCFEQASSANYPNIMVLGYLEQHDAVDPDLVAKTSALLDRGYKKLVGYESPKKGYEWFGGDPGHEALTAYGLMEFADMTAVYGDVDRGMIDRTAAWLASRRDGKGGYQRNSRALDSFGRASDEVTNGYVTYALAEAGYKVGSAELSYQKRIAVDSDDPYVLALAANTLAIAEPDAPGTAKAIGKLAAVQGKDGGFTGADHSITRSGGQALAIETTSLAAMALIRAGKARGEPVRRAVDWLNTNRSGFGGYGSTQSTVLALKALSRHADATRATPASGVVTLVVNGKRVGRVAYEKGRRDPIEFPDAARALRPGKNTIELRLASEAPLPYSAAITYRSVQPASSPETQVAVRTRLARTEVPVGEGVRVKVEVENVTSKGVPMTLARVGIPGGLTFQTWQLKELRDKQIIDFYETREREVILYFRSLPPREVRTIDLDLLARVPGVFTAPASRAYLYYTDEYKHWVAPLQVTVRR